MAHTYWRILSVTDSGGLALGQISMANAIGGANQCTGGTASANSTYGGYVAANCFTGNPSDFWSSNGDSLNVWIQYQFPSPVDVIELVIFPRPDYLANTQGLRLFDLQYSDDGTNFTTVANWYPATWNAGVSQTFDVSPIANIVVDSAMVESLTNLGPSPDAVVSATFIEALTALTSVGNARVACNVIEVLTPIYSPTPQPTGGWVCVIQ